MADKYLNRLKVMLVEKSAMSNYRPKNSTKAQQPLYMVYERITATVGNAYVNN